MYNTIITVCHLVSDPELRETSGGKKVCKMRVCVSGNKAKTKCFLDCEAWERTAEVCAEYLKKGREVLIQGELCMDTWEKDGKTQSKCFIRAATVQFLSSSKPAEGGAAPSSRGAGADTDVDDDIPF